MVEEGLKDLEQDLHVQGMETDTRFVKDEERCRLRSPHFTGQFQALGFAAGKAGRFFAEGEVPQAQAVEGGEFLGDVLPVGAKFKGGVDIHGHHFRKGQGLAFFIGQADLHCGRGIA